MSTRKRYIAATLVGIGGTVLVFQLLDWLNRPAALPDKRAATTPVDFRVARQPKRKVVAPRPQPKRQRRQVRRPRAPLPNLATSLTGVNFGIPPLSADALTAAQDALIGEDSVLEDVVMTARSVDELPKPAERVSPVYPPRARAEGLTGKVKLRMLVGRDGRVVEAKVIEATPKGVFEQSALSAVRRWRYTPARYRGRPVNMWAEMLMRFDLG